MPAQKRCSPDNPHDDEEPKLQPRPKQSRSNHDPELLLQRHEELGKLLDEEADEEEQEEEEVKQQVSIDEEEEEEAEDTAEGVVFSSSFSLYLSPLCSFVSL